MTAASAGSPSQFAAALLDPSVAVAGLKVWNGSDPACRLAIHRNNVIASLVDALADTFPVVQELVGSEFFRAMAAVFVRQAPPRSRILAKYGEEFPGFIEQFEPARGVPYLADMGRLEFARVRAYHAADDKAVESEELRLAMPGFDQIAQLRHLSPASLSLVQSQFAIVSLWAAHPGQGDLTQIDPFEPQDALVLRDGLEVLVLRVPRAAPAEM